MSLQNQLQRNNWTSRLSFIIAAAGSAVGLGNIWKFPYITGLNGGGAFVLVYLLCVAAIGLPLMIAEIYIGQQSQSNLVDAYSKLHKKNSIFRITGVLGLVTAFIILSFYGMVGGWIFDFAFMSLFDKFNGHTDEEIKMFFSTLFTSPWRQVFWHFVFTCITVGIVAGGINKGVERWNVILMPLLMVLLILLTIKSFFLPGFTKALEFLFRPEFAKLTSKGLLEAVGHSFFTLSLGIGILITYGSYLPKKQTLVKSALAIAFFDTFIALCAGLVIFSVVFTFNIEPGSGPTLTFVTLPVLFAKIPGGYFVSLAFFLLFAFAAITSAISLLEVIITFCVDRYNISRVACAMVGGALIFIFGILSDLSSTILKNVTLLGLDLFSFFDKITSSIFMPIGGMCISLFFGWIIGSKKMTNIHQYPLTKKIAVIAIIWITRIIAPIAIMVIFINALKEW